MISAKSGALTLHRPAGPSLRVGMSSTDTRLPTSSRTAIAPDAPMSIPRIAAISVRLRDRRVSLTRYGLGELDFGLREKVECRVRPLDSELKRNRPVRAAVRRLFVSCGRQPSSRAVAPRAGF